MKKSNHAKKLFQVGNYLRTSIILLMCIIFSNVNAQQKSVSGTILDESGTSLPGVNVIIDGASRGVQSDFDGNYSIEAASNETIIFSYVGMKTVSVVVGNKTTIDVTLVNENTLDEVVVIGYGTKKIDDIVGSVAIIDPQEMNNLVGDTDFFETLEELRNRCIALRESHKK